MTDWLRKRDDFSNQSQNYDTENTLNASEVTFRGAYEKLIQNDDFVNTTLYVLYFRKYFILIPLGFVMKVLFDFPYTVFIKHQQDNTCNL